MTGKKLKNGFAARQRSLRDARRILAYSSGVSLSYPIVLHKTEEGFAVNCPALPGCWSQGSTEEEATENIRDAIREYLAAISDAFSAETLRQVEVTI